MTGELSNKSFLPAIKSTDLVKQLKIFEVFMQLKTVLKNLSLLVLAFVIFYGCDKSSDINNNDTIYGSGKIVSQTREVEECSGLTIQNMGEIYLTQDNSQSIRIEADDNIMNQVISNKVNGALVIGLKDGSYSNVTLRAYVSLKTIESITINGAGKITTQNSLNCDNLDLIINGAGDVTVLGNSNYMYCFINGAGNVMAKDFSVQKCKAMVNGTGNITLTVTEDLDATVNGAGNIYYYGNPANVTTSIIGVGHIVRQ